MGQPGSATHAMPITTAGEGCSHERVTRRGTNAYITMVSCADCGKVLLKEPKETTRTDTTMTTMAPGECPHPESRISWRGTNAHVWKWTCSQCGASQSHRKTSGAEKPVPGRQRGLPSVEDSGGRSTGGSQASGSQAAGYSTGGLGEQQLREEVIFYNPQDWQRFSQLLDRMVVSHMAIYGQVTHNDFQRITNATALCYKQFGPVFAGPAPTLRSASSATPHRSTASTSEAGDISGNNNYLWQVQGLHVRLHLRD